MEVAQLEPRAHRQPDGVVAGVAHGRPDGVVQHREQHVHTARRQHQQQHDVAVEDHLLQRMHGQSRPGADVHVAVMPGVDVLVHQAPVQQPVTGPEVQDRPDGDQTEQHHEPDRVVAEGPVPDDPVGVGPPGQRLPGGGGQHHRDQHNVAGPDLQNPPQPQRLGLGQPWPGELAGLCTDGVHFAARSGVWSASGTMRDWAQAVWMNSTQLPSGSSTMAMVTPGRTSSRGHTMGRPAASQSATTAAMSSTVMVK